MNFIKLGCACTIYLYHKNAEVTRTTGSDFSTSQYAEIKKKLLGI